MKKSNYNNPPSIEACLDKPPDVALPPRKAKPVKYRRATPISQVKGYRTLSKNDKAEVQKFKKFLKLVNAAKIDSVKAIDVIYKQVYGT